MEHPSECVFQAESCVRERQAGRPLSRVPCGAAMFHRPPVTRQGNRATPTHFPHTDVVDDLLTGAGISGGEALAFAHQERILPPLTPTDTTPSPTAGCGQACAAVYEPVCGTDGRTHGNRCFLQAAACEAGDPDAVAVEHEGACCRVKCPPTWRPVCDSDGHTHPVSLTPSTLRLTGSGESCRTCASSAWLAAWRFGCRGETWSWPRSPPASTRPVEASSARTTTPRSAAQMVGSSVCTVRLCALSSSHERSLHLEGRSYPNECELNRAQCLSKESGRDLTLDYPGECCRNDCTAEFEVN